MADACYGYNAECPAGDRDCILGCGHQGLHVNRAGFTWTEEEAADAAVRVFARDAPDVGESAP
jgi:hypothetical protein